MGGDEARPVERGGFWRIEGLDAQTDGE